MLILLIIHMHITFEKVLFLHMHFFFPKRHRMIDSPNKGAYSHRLDIYNKLY